MIKKRCKNALKSNFKAKNMFHILTLSGLIGLGIQKTGGIQYAEHV
jgi:hypothetical protein